MDRIVFTIPFAKFLAIILLPFYWILLLFVLKFWAYSLRFLSRKFFILTVNITNIITMMMMIIVVIITISSSSSSLLSSSSSSSSSLSSSSSSHHLRHHHHPSHHHYCLVLHDDVIKYQMETFFALLAICAGNSPAFGEFPAQRPVTRSFDVYFDLCLNKRLRKQSWGWWFETLSPHHDVIVMDYPKCRYQTCSSYTHLWSVEKALYNRDLFRKPLITMIPLCFNSNTNCSRHCSHE